MRIDYFCQRNQSYALQKVLVAVCITNAYQKPKVLRVLHIKFLMSQAIFGICGHIVGISESLFGSVLYHEKILQVSWVVRMYTSPLRIVMNEYL